jgi:hypothetical protein
LLMSSVCKINTLLAGNGCGGGGVKIMQGAQGKLTSNMGHVRMGIHHHEQWISFPSMIIFLLSKYVPA